MHKKICIFTTAHPPFDVRIYHRQARSLCEADYNVVLLVAGKIHKSPGDGIKIKEIKRGKHRLWRFLSIFKMFSHCVREKADLYHFHDPELLPVGCALKHIMRKPVIYDCHENYPEVAYERTWYPQWFKPVLSKSIAFFEPSLAKCLDAVVCVVPDQQPRFERKKCLTVLVQNFPRLEIFQNENYKAIARENKIIYLGNLSQARGIQTLIQMMTRLAQSHPHIKLVCLGTFSEQHVKTNTLKWIQKYNLSTKIEFLPPVPHPQVPNHLFSSRIGLAPFLPQKHTMKMFAPNKIFEYMACKLPVVASRLPSLERIISDSGAGIMFDPTDPDDLYQKVVMLLDDEHLSSTLGSNGHDFVFRNFNWKHEEKKLLTLYQRLL